MPRKVIAPNSEFPYHVNVRCNNREWFAIPMHEVWSIMEDYLSFISHAYGVEVISFVLMSNHFHLLIRAPNANLAEAMNYFLRETSRQIAARSGRINKIYGARFHRTLVTDIRYFLTVYKYVYRNPFEAGMCAGVHEYPYSTLYRKLGKAPLHFPIAYDDTLFSGIDSTLRWLNEVPSVEDTDLVRKALRKKVFELLTDYRTGKESELKYRLY